jgi:phage shock protein A
VPSNPPTLADVQAAVQSARQILRDFQASLADPAVTAAAAQQDITTAKAQIRAQLTQMQAAIDGLTTRVTALETKLGTP